MKAILKRLSVVAVMAAIAICFGVPATTHAATTLPKTGWNEVSKGVWMYDGNGDLVADTNTSVIELNGKTYYVGAEGVMVTNKWVNTGSDQVPVMHYYLADGSRVENGWVSIASVRYHFTAGTLDANKFFSDVDGKEYLLAKDGKVVTGWVNNGTVLVPIMNYYAADGAQVKNDWALIAGAWYHFDATGLKETSKQFTDAVDGKDYILDKDGKMITGWTKDGSSKWVLAGPSGSLQTGWVKSSGVWYFLQDSTKGYEMATSIVISGATAADPSYYVNADGSWKTNKGWISNTQYVGDKGVLKCSDWALVDGLWYYFDANGTMVTNDVVTHEKTINGVSWFFNADGSLVTKAGLYDVYRAVGGKVANGWVLVSASDKLGTTSNWLYCKDGIAETNKWVSYNGSWYFLDVDGNMVAGKEAVDPTTSLDYYFNAAGVMQVGTFKIGGVDKTFGPSGAFIR